MDATYRAIARIMDPAPEGEEWSGVSNWGTAAMNVLLLGVCGTNEQRVEAARWWCNLPPNEREGLKGPLRRFARRIDDFVGT